MYARAYCVEAHVLTTMPKVKESPFVDTNFFSARGRGTDHEKKLKGELWDCSRTRLPWLLGQEGLQLQPVEHDSCGPICPPATSTSSVLSPKA